MFGVGIAIGIGIETGRLSLKSIPIQNPIPIPMTPARWHLYTVSQSERNSEICYKSQSKRTITKLWDVAIGHFITPTDPPPSIGEVIFFLPPLAVRGERSRIRGSQREGA